MEKDELIRILNSWKADADPENRSRDYSIENSHISNQEEITVIINRREMLKVNFSLNESGKVIIENNEDPNFSGYVTPESFKALLNGL